MIEHDTYTSSCVQYLCGSFITGVGGDGGFYMQYIFTMHMPSKLMICIPLRFDE